MIYQHEITSGIISVVSGNLGATEDEIVTSVSRMLGFKATSSTLRRTITDAIQSCLEQGKLQLSDTLLVHSEANDSLVVE